MADKEKKDEAVIEAAGPRFEIRTPNALFKGVRASVRFTDGVGFSEDLTAAKACRDFGYQVIDRAAKAKK